ncbi:TetR/AcrR family transcriptional regulator [Streptosporangium sp. NBC_01756]|uniref:TetR/AcrR family transcriptional regulator n=1 Tax=Streptosporangium sp. NBC_01756 TaxID=2975950 RepID=UPI002DD8EABC|nr:helix-turn-helix domain-containing protein [Streptosporangium sp. NBC_01756]WSC84927.1 TetR/AcrR family transcriptional regulator [Streptosporangium sp. NBC_01756]
MAEAVRADARRNYEHLLAVAGEAFAEHGTDASLRDVARRAGVGIGTLYRHFPTRETLLEALMSSRFDVLRASAEDLLGAPSPRDGLLAWLREFAVGSTAYRGLPESVMTALREEGSELHASCHAMRAAGGRLLARAQESGAVRADLTAGELLALVAGIAWASEQSAEPTGMIDRMLSLTTTGIAADRSADTTPA